MSGQCPSSGGCPASRGWRQPGQSYHYQFKPSFFDRTWHRCTNVWPVSFSWRMSSFAWLKTRRKRMAVWALLTLALCRKVRFKGAYRLTAVVGTAIWAPSHSTSHLLRLCIDLEIGYHRINHRVPHLPVSCTWPNEGHLRMHVSERKFSSLFRISMKFILSVQFTKTLHWFKW